MHKIHPICQESYYIIVLVTHNWSKQIQETHTACCDGTQEMRESLNETEVTWPLSYKRHVTVMLASPYGKPVISKPFDGSKTGG